ncbi:MAG TPA: beta-galactosidase GalA [Saprospiraceae bacterium]|nr:beta-galactosidase GalA [Saprospiraceae bacterium]
MNRSILFFLLLLFSHPITSATQDSPVREHLNFDEGWRFHFGHADDPLQDFNYGIPAVFAKAGNGQNTPIAPTFVDTLWRVLDLPHDWAVELPFVYDAHPDIMSHGYKPVGGQFPKTSIGWYRKHFELPASDLGRRLQVQFDGVFRDAEFWLNGFYLGNNESGYLGQVYDITDVANYGGENVLVVRVDARQKEGWFYEGAGIYRHVWLNKYAPIHIAHEGVFVHAEVSSVEAMITVETFVKNEDPKLAKLELETQLRSRAGEVLAKATTTDIPLPDGTEVKVLQEIKLNNPRLWGLDHPYLYRIQVLLKQNGRIIDQQTLRYGLRDIQVKTDGIYLNGEHLKLQGVNCHQDHAGVGSALPDYLQYYRIALLKEMGVNTYRTSHNPPTPELLDACDSLGMLVMDENRLLNTGREHLDQFERLLRRDRSRTCVFMWCIGNEEFGIQQTDYGKRIAQTLVRRQQQLDPTRTCTYASDLANVFRGVNEVIPVRSFNYRHFAVADYHRDHPEQPIIGTEMGSTVSTRGVYTIDSLRGYLPDQDINAPWWASRAEVWWPLAAENDYWLGGFIWTGFDYRGEPTPFSWPNVNSHFGVMDMCGFPKNIYYYYQSWWTDKDVLHVSPHWNWPGREGESIEVWVNSNADAVELFLNDKSLGKKEMPRNSHLKWPVIYQPGELKAVAFKNRRTFSESQRTTGPAVAIQLSPSKTILLADGQDATVINVSVVDAEGRMVPNAQHKIAFEVDGPAQIIGVGNGDPSSHEPDKGLNNIWERSLFNGRCQVILQSENQASEVQFKARAPGLKTGLLYLETN